MRKSPAQTCPRSGKKSIVFGAVSLRRGIRRHQGRLPVSGYSQTTLSYVMVNSSE
jgi:hypothetical protein